MNDFTKMENVSAALGLPRPIPAENKVLNALQVAKQTIDGWTRDSEGRVTVHPDVVSKAVNAAIAELERGSQGGSRE